MSDKPTHSQSCPSPASCPVTAVAKVFRLPKPPLFLVAVPVLGFCTLLLVAAAIYKARFATSDQPRILVPQDMARQPKFKAQGTSTFFADGRAMREPVEGTVAYAAGYSFGHEIPDALRLKADDHFFRGYQVSAEGKPVVKVSADGKTKDLAFFSGYPKSQLVVDASLLTVGQAKFNRTCAMCHGKDGSGQGPVALRAAALGAEDNNPTATSWTAPADLRDAKFSEAGGYPNGKLFFTANHGAGAMAGYGSQLSEREGWAIVAYVRSLQRVAQPAK